MEDTLRTQVEAFAETLRDADAIIVGAGAGMSTAAGMHYTGTRFTEHFTDFIDVYGFTDMYSGGFYSFPSPREHWAYWSRYVHLNRYTPAPRDTYRVLLDLLAGRDYFVVTTNVDHQFQQAGIDRRRLFYTQGDFGLFQCSVPCHNETYDNETVITQMVARQTNRQVPEDLIPWCPRCGAPMAMNLRADLTFVEDVGWYQAAKRYQGFLAAHKTGRVLYLELGVGGNTPGIIKYPFWQRTFANAQARFVCINAGQAITDEAIRARSITINADIDAVLRQVRDDR